MGAAIQISGVSKRFRLHHEKYTSVKERMIHLGRIPYTDLWALRDVDIEIEQGETFGLLGHNGSGKSTLLKCVAGILQPTFGEIRIVGRVAALLELGAGFHPDLTGRENVFLNTSLLGLSHREIERKFDEIVQFAELEEFIDNQVKYYSSGMYVRLGFAVAVNMDPDILLVDEVLAVGDELFQRKCLDRVRQFLQREGRTIVFVTHGADLVRQICDRAAVFDKGYVVSQGTPGEAVRAFREHLLIRERFDHGDAPVEEVPEGADTEIVPATEEEPDSHEHRRTFKVRISDVKFLHEESRPYLVPGDPLTVRISYETSGPVGDAMFGVAVYNLEGDMLFGTNTKILGLTAPVVDGRSHVDFVFDGVPLTDGTYPVTIGITNDEESTIYDWWEQRVQFEVMNPGRAVGMLLVPTTVDFKVDAEDAATAAGSL